MRIHLDDDERLTDVHELDRDVTAGLAAAADNDVVLQGRNASLHLAPLP